MRIERIRREDLPGHQRVAADVIWEDAARPSRTVYFEIPDTGHGELEIRPEAFLVGAAVPALEHGERRIAVDGVVCPVVRSSLPQALAKIAGWFPSSAPGGIPRIECDERAPAPAVVAASASRRRAVFLSGGVDSLGVLAENLSTTDAGAPERMQAGIFVHGFDIGGEETGPAHRQFYEAYFARLRDTVATEGIELLPIATNIKLLEEDWDVWRRRFHGAGLAAVAHALAPRFTDVGVAAALPRSAVTPWGSHPELDALYSGADVRLTHEGADELRMDRLLRVAAWPEGLRVLRICWRSDVPPETPNCGRCTKCIRTVAPLAALGLLSASGAFPFADVTREDVAAVKIRSAPLLRMLPQINAFLREHGRDDLAAGFDDAVADYHVWAAWESAPPPARWRAALRNADDRVSGGALRRLVRRVVPARPPRAAD